MHKTSNNLNVVLKARLCRFAGVLGAAAVWVATFAAIQPAQAQNAVAPGISLNRFEPAEVGSDWFNMESLDLRGDGRFALGLYGNFARKPLVIFDAAGNEASTPVENQLMFHLGGSVILRDRFRISASLPLVAVNDGDKGTIGSQDFQVQDGFSVGDLRLGADVRLLGEYGSPFTLALGAQVHLPTGNREAFASDGKVRIVPRLAASGIIGTFQYAVRAAFDGRLEQGNIGNQPFGSEVEFGAAVGLRLAGGKVIVGPEFYGSTLVTDDATFKEAGTPMEAILGAHFAVAKKFRFGVGGGPGLNRTIGSPEMRFLANLAYFPDYKESDRDKDGIADAQDACPAEAGPATDDPDTNGCPDSDGDQIVDKFDACPREPGLPNKDPNKHGCPPPKDTDGDGIMDPDDACPLEAGEANDDPKKHGCPPPKDTDGDGIMDPDDACPLEPGDPNDDPKQHGCPPPPDTDGDGIVDPVDACPREAGVEQDDPARNGCPPDRDGDGILDNDDACPDEAGEPDKNPKKNGCPKVQLVEKEIKILETIEFDTDKAKIRPESFGVIDAVRKVMVAHPEILRIQVEGHTDSRGAARYNRNLSQKRAESVVQWLVDAGIEPGRLTPVGFGEDRPIADNSTREGLQANRRSQFIILEKAPVPAAE